MSLVSIIIPCYNYGWLLSETLESVLEQSYEKWECIIIDDGSKDDTKHVAESYQAKDSRFRYVYQSNGGMSSARNHGLLLARGEYIQFLDADDLIVSHKLEIQSSFLAKNAHVDIVYGGVRYFRHGERNVMSHSFDMQDRPWMTPLKGKGASILKEMIEENQMVTNAPLLRSSVIEKVGMFSVNMRGMEDWDFWVRCAAANMYFHYDQDPNTWTLVRVHPTSTSQNHQMMLTYMEKVREQLKSSLKSFGDESIIARNQELLNNIRLENAKYNLQHGNAIAGIAGFLKIAKSTGQYMYYASSAFYWLRRREKSS
jgi:glycosyltransferase involved in cell wall biosynthesis